MIECDLLPHPPNGQVIVTGTEEGGVAVYICDEGFVLEGTPIRECGSDGTWSGEEPTCEGDLDNCKYELL